MNIKKRITAVIFALLMVVSCSVAVSAHTFKDVVKYDQAIGMLSELGVIKGYTSSEFGPDDDVTRWQMALMISKLITGNVETSTWEAKGSTSAFSDVKENHYLGSINYAHKNKVIIGRSDTVFAPEEKITVQDGITMIVRALGYPSEALNAGYPDSYINKGKDLGLMENLSNLGYEDSLTRGQTAQMLYNALFAVTFDESTIASKAFKYVNQTIVLTSTENLRISTNVNYAKSGKLIFSVLSSYGIFSDSFTLDATLFNFKDATANDFIGVAFDIEAIGDYANVLSISQRSKEVTASDKMNINGDNNTISFGGVTYKTVNSFTEKHIDTKIPSAREIIVYSMNDLLGSGSITLGKKMAGTNQYYKMTAYDDNNDGYADRAVYIPYSFGQYKADESGKIAIAGNKSPSEFTITGQTAIKDGDYVLYSYDSQTKIFNVDKIYEVKKGKFTAYFATNNNIQIDSASYYLGNDMLSGASVAKVSKDIVTANMSSVIGSTVEYVLDNNFVVHIAIVEDTEKDGNKFYNTKLAVVSDVGNNINNIIVYLNGETSKSGNGYIVTMIDGAAASYSNTLAKGDVIEYTYKINTTTNTINLNAKRIQTAPTYTTTMASSAMSVANTTFSITEGTTTKPIVRVNNETLIFEYDLTTAAPIQKPVSGYSSNFTAYQSLYISYGETFDGFADFIYIRPFDVSTIGSDYNDFSSIVYIGTTDINTPTTTAGYWNYNSYDITTDQSATVKLKQSTTSFAALSVPGYYKVVNGFITSNVPINASAKGNSLSLQKGVNVSKIESTVEGYYTVTIGNATYYVPTDSLRLYFISSTNVGYSISKAEAAVLQNYITNNVLTLKISDVIIYTLPNYYINGNMYMGPMFIIQ